MDCPKCNAKMIESSVETLYGKVVIDQCSSCKGLWFDNGEAEQLKESWMSDFVDLGNAKTGKKFNRVHAMQCPRCSKPTARIADAKQSHLEFEACADHGIFMDASEFTDYKHETLLDTFKNLVASIRKR